MFRRKREFDIEESGERFYKRVINGIKGVKNILGNTSETALYFMATMSFLSAIPDIMRGDWDYLTIGGKVTFGSGLIYTSKRISSRETRFLKSINMHQLA